MSGLQKIMFISLFFLERSKPSEKVENISGLKASVWSLWTGLRDPLILHVKFKVIEFEGNNVG